MSLGALSLLAFFSLGLCLPNFFSLPAQPLVLLTSASEPGLQGGFPSSDVMGLPIISSLPLGETKFLIVMAPLLTC